MGVPDDVWKHAVLMTAGERHDFEMGLLVEESCMCNCFLGSMPCELRCAHDVLFVVVDSHGSPQHFKVPQA